MKPRHWDDEIFWERLADMPDAEAIEVLRLRRIELIERRAEPQARYDRSLQLETEAALAKINQHMHWIANRDSKINIQSAVRAVLGDEGWAKVREWMAKSETSLKGATR